MFLTLKETADQVNTEITIAQEDRPSGLCAFGGQAKQQELLKV